MDASLSSITPQQGTEDKTRTHARVGRHPERSHPGTQCHTTVSDKVREMESRVVIARALGSAGGRWAGGHRSLPRGALRGAHPGVHATAQNSHKRVREARGTRYRVRLVSFVGLCHNEAQHHHWIQVPSGRCLGKRQGRLQPSLNRAIKWEGRVTALPVQRQIPKPWSGVSARSDLRGPTWEKGRAPCDWPLLAAPEGPTQHEHRAQEVGMPGHNASSCPPTCD